MTVDEWMKFRRNFVELDLSFNAQYRARYIDRIVPEKTLEDDNWAYAENNKLLALMNTIGNCPICGQSVQIIHHQPNGRECSERALQVIRRVNSV